MKDKELVQKQFKFKKVSVHSSVSNPYTNKSYVRYAFLIEKLLRSLSLAIIGIHHRVFEQTMCTFSLVHRKPLYFVSNACYIYIYIYVVKQVCVYAVLSLVANRPVRVT